MVACRGAAIRTVGPVFLVRTLSIRGGMGGEGRAETERMRPRMRTRDTAGRVGRGSVTRPAATEGVEGRVSGGDRPGVAGRAGHRRPGLGAEVGTAARGVATGDPVGTRQRLVDTAAMVGMAGRVTRSGRAGTAGREGRALAMGGAGTAGTVVTRHWAQIGAEVTVGLGDPEGGLREEAAAMVGMGATATALGRGEWAGAAGAGVKGIRSPRSAGRGGGEARVGTVDGVEGTGRVETGVGEGRAVRVRHRAGEGATAERVGTAGRAGWACFR